MSAQCFHVTAFIFTQYLDLRHSDQRKGKRRAFHAFLRCYCRWTKTAERWSNMQQRIPADVERRTLWSLAQSTHSVLHIFNTDPSGHDKISANLHPTTFKWHGNINSERPCKNCIRVQSPDNPVIKTLVASVLIVAPSANQDNRLSLWMSTWIQTQLKHFWQIQKVGSCVGTCD